MSSFLNSKILVVGGAGFVGSNLVKILLTQHKPSNIFIVDNLLSSEIENLPKDDRITFIKGGIQQDEILKQIDDSFDYIFHLATFHGNQSSILDPIKDHENNTLTTLKLLNHIKDFKNLKKFVYSGAGCASAKKTFENNAIATSEDAPISMEQDSPYSISKLIGEFYCAYFYKQHGVKTAVARFQNVYGPGEILGAGEWRGTSATVWRNVTPTFIFKSIKGEVLPLQNGGIASRDFIFVTDIANGLIAIALKGVEGETYNLASGVQTTILELAKLIVEITKNNAGFDLLPKRDWDTSGFRYGSPEKAKKVLNFNCVTKLQDGLQETVKWTLNNMDLIEKNIRKHDIEMKKITF